MNVLLTVSIFTTLVRGGGLIHTGGMEGSGTPTHTRTTVVEKKSKSLQWPLHDPQTTHTSKSYPWCLAINLNTMCYTHTSKYNQSQFCLTIQSKEPRLSTTRDC